MINIVEHNKIFNYKIYEAPEFSSMDLNAVRYESNAAYSKYMKLFGELNPSSRHGSKFYNIFSITAGFPYFYKIYRCIKFSVYDYLGENSQNLFIQAWLNYDTIDKTLDWHNHSYIFLCHGYMNIDPKNTNTEFDEYSITNKPGQIYIGPSNRRHKVVVNEPYINHRITVAFDVINLENIIKEGRKLTDQHCSLIPL